MRRLALVLTVLAFPSLAFAAQGSIAVPYADVTASATAQAVCGGSNASRVSCTCTNDDAALNVRFGGATTGALAPTTTKGVRLPAGASITMTNSGINAVIAESGSPVVSCTDYQ